MAVENVPVEHTPDEADDLRVRVTQRLRDRAHFRTHLLIYVLVNAFLILIWWIVGSSLFWPVFPLVGWGIGVAANAWEVYRTDPTSGERIQREIDWMRS